MISASLRGRYDSDVSGAIGTVTVDGGAVKLKANMTDATFVNGPSLEGLSLSLEKPGSFLIDYDVPKKDVHFQFMNTVRVLEKPLNFTYKHWRGDNRTALDGTLMIDSANKLSANYVFDSGNCKLKYSYVHRGLTTFEPSYDFAKNSWDVSVSQRVYEDDVVKASYQSSSKILGLEWSRNSSLSRGFKISASVNLAENSKFPTLSAESRLNFDMQLVNL
ncbi:outer envelope pore protein 24, chloroplastic-like [Nicotiana tabacum]|uniref:Outer envelope pore protein 24, chloroplastic-like n=1 Tax=Nicotiana tabacum TaxID=4097 RepID=A0A1S4DQ59_TOBAC|nr:outer envelope pore protein 24, chloroplastic-like [Nicotiana tomentosiformis]XP_016515555.1 PREDICTED: outer envelope pore protein 24, chloroplastic-like [Nicotiana tabacum]